MHLVSSYFRSDMSHCLLIFRNGNPKLYWLLVYRHYFNVWNWYYENEQVNSKHSCKWSICIHLYRLLSSSTSWYCLFIYIIIQLWTFIHFYSKNLIYLGLIIHCKLQYLYVASKETRTVFLQLICIQSWYLTG